MSVIGPITVFCIVDDNIQKSERTMRCSIHTHVNSVTMANTVERGAREFLLFTHRERRLCDLIDVVGTSDDSVIGKACDMWPSQTQINTNKLQVLYMPELPLTPSFHQTTTIYSSSITVSAFP